MSEDDNRGPAVPERIDAAYIAELRQAADRRVIMAEMKAHAMSAGMVDPDGLKLLDTSGVSLDEHGEIHLPDGFFEAARKAKPYLFSGSVAGSTARAPATTPTRFRSATEMSFDEWQAARSALLRRGPM